MRMLYGVLQAAVLCAQSAGGTEPISSPLTFHMRVRAPRSSVLAPNNDTCYAAYARYAILNGGSVGTEDDDDKTRNYVIVDDKTLEECKQLCEDGTWEGCLGFSREERHTHSATQRAGCFWVDDLNYFLREVDDDSSYTETLYSEDATGLRNATHDNLAGCCYRGITTGYCQGNAVGCTENCGVDSAVGLSWVQLSAGQNYAPAMVQLGEMYLLGDAGLKVDQQKAYDDYFAPAASAGNQDAQYFIGAAYAGGGTAGYKADPQQAWMWYTLSRQRALKVNDNGDAAAAQSALQDLQSTCTSTCQTQAMAMAAAWALEKNACQLEGAAKTRASFCSNNGDPIATAANDPGGADLYTSCRCLCDDGFFFLETADGGFGCIAGAETTTTTTTTTVPCWKTGKCTSTLTTTTKLNTTTVTTSTAAHKCDLSGDAFFGPWMNEVGIGLPYSHEVGVSVQRCAGLCLKDPQCKGILGGWEGGKKVANKPGCWLWNTTKHEHNTAPGAWTDNGTLLKQKNMKYYARDKTKCHHHRPNQTTTTKTTTTKAHTTCNNGGCIPKNVKRKVGQPSCCTEGHMSLKCPGPAHYKCGTHGMDSAVFNRTVMVAGSAQPTL